MDPLNPENLGARLRTARTRRGLSMRELAARSGVSVSFLSRIEGGKASPTIATIRKLLSTLEITTDDFFRDARGRGDARVLVFGRHTMPTVVREGVRRVVALPSRPPDGAEVLYEELAPGAILEESPGLTVDLCGYVICGLLGIEVAGRETVRAGNDDAFFVPAHVEHRTRNVGDVPTRLLRVKLPGASGGPVV
jgi:transcriptional regulator with XRE-family HTH domain